MYVRSHSTGAITEILEREGAWPRKFYFTRYEEEIKNALKWRKPDLSRFISKKVDFFIRKSYLNLNMTSYITTFLLIKLERSGFRHFKAFLISSSYLVK